MTVDGVTYSRKLTAKQIEEMHVKIAGLIRDCLMASDKPLGLCQIGDRLGLSPSTVNAVSAKMEDVAETDKAKLFLISREYACAL